MNPAFFIPGETIGEVIFTLDGDKVLFCPQPISKIGEGSDKNAPLYFKKYENKQICLLCSTELKSTKLWTARSHFLHCHQSFCDIEELTKHNKKWMDEIYDKWKKADEKSKQPVIIYAKKRSIENFLIKNSTSQYSLAELSNLRRIMVTTIARGLLPFSFINNPGYKFFINIKLKHIIKYIYVKFKY